jgi:hypothetical protein
MTEVLFWVAATPVILFPVLYAVVARWWRTPVGRHEMVLALALLALVAIGLLHRAFGSGYPGEAGFRVGVYLFVALALWWRLILLVRVQIHARWKKGL